MRDLAKLANVSISTVSKAFNNADDINEETKNHIINIAKQNGCYGKYCKDKYPKKVIAIISRELGGDYYKDIVEKFEHTMYCGKRSAAGCVFLFLTAIRRSRFYCLQGKIILNVFASCSIVKVSVIQKICAHPERLG